MKHHPQKKLFRYIGIAGTLVCLIIFILAPSFPTPDKLFVFLVFVFMIFGQATELVRRLLPFLAILLVYESFRGLAPLINHRVEYSLMPKIDRALFGQLPTHWLQKMWWHGHTVWYDYLFYLPYLLHFVLPIGLAILVWKKRVKYYWQVVSSYLTVSFMGFFTFLLLPAAPPWMASDRGLIAPITRISSQVWFGLGLHDFPSVYNKIAPNAVAAVPSLHAAYSALFSIIVFKFFGKKWGMISLIYPIILCIGVIYEGEHYFFDVLLGIIYAFAAYYLARLLMPKFKNLLFRSVG